MEIAGKSNSNSEQTKSQKRTPNLMGKINFVAYFIRDPYALELSHSVNSDNF